MITCASRHRRTSRVKGTTQTRSSPVCKTRKRFAPPDVSCVPRIAGPDRQTDRQLALLEIQQRQAFSLQQDHLTRRFGRHMPACQPLPVTLQDKMPTMHLRLLPLKPHQLLELQNSPRQEWSGQECACMRGMGAAHVWNWWERVEKNAGFGP